MIASLPARRPGATAPPLSAVPPRSHSRSPESTPPAFPRTSVRVRLSNLNHHLWNNNGTWYVHYTVHPTPLTKSRIRASLGTKCVTTARQLRDELLRQAGA